MNEPKGLTISTDYHDFYDEFFPIPSTRTHIVLTRKKDAFMDLKSQMEYLDAAGFKTPKHGYAKSLTSEIKYGDLFSFEITDTLMFFVADIEGKIKPISLEAARNIDKQTYLREHIPANPTDQGVVMKYVQFGHLHAWVDIRGDNPIIDEENASHIKVVSKGPISMVKLPNINLPLYSIDFVVTKSGPIAIGLNAAPNLSLLGIDKIYSSEEVAKSIQNQVLHSLCNDED